RLQLVFQEATTALAPQKTVRELLEEALALAPRDKRNARSTSADYLAKVGMSAELLERFADELSSGEAQRVDLARRQAVRPEVVLLDAPHIAGLIDEPNGTRPSGTSSLETLLRAERAEGRSFLIAEPTAIPLRDLADRMAILFAGRIVELGP